ncbi:M15 family metallopeptidase [Phormidium yuhuli AB48]|uniref:M15 family metallopeptidase n=1 Tax=Phormidium yuhuli AB48 TaxID=2940671 RepID=A0ABY5AL07_9CYAN|nr:M15 family metallopeptidase [Phormidium yuhuli]USR89822.1 M15 family metallopeptidase [Phormidium yuhuli AB48]
MVDDIPEALRDRPLERPSGTPTTSTATTGMPILFLIFALTASVALGGLGWYLWQNQGQGPRLAESTSTSPEEMTPATDGTSAENPNLLGHFPYEEAPPEDLRPIVSDNTIQLRAAAAEAYLEMEAAARADGVWLMPLSGFRSVEDQEYLFFEIKAQRGQVPSQRAAVSAPPGYSEHHTGYAIDIGDADVPATNLSPDFENTAAFKWLRENAAYFSFELSFPRDNPQNIMYEPWHWRFVGDRHSLETFYKARELFEDGELEEFD